MSVLAHVRVGGRPRTKGSLKVYCTKGRDHKIHLEEEVAESKAWRKVVARALREDQQRQYGRFLRHPGPVEVRLVFFFPREEAVAGGPIPTHDTEYPTAITLGDVDKLARNVLDALSAPKKREHVPLCSGLIQDDSQVSPTLWVGKFWVPEDREPGVQILVLEAPPVEVALAEAEAKMGGWLQ